MNRDINEQNPRYLEAKTLLLMFEGFDGHIWIDNNGLYSLGVYRKRFPDFVTEEGARDRSRYPFKHMFRFRNSDNLYRELRRWIGRQQRAGVL